MKSIKILSTVLAMVAFTSCAAVFELARNPKNVLYVRTDGNDATAWYGYTNRAWRTITGAVAFAHSGDKISIGPGNFTNPAIGNLSIPVNVSIIGSGTNSTFVYHHKWQFEQSNEIANLTFDGRFSEIPGVGLFDLGLNCYFHNLVMISTNQCITTFGSVDESGYNVFSNCLFSTSFNGISISGITNYFFNCSIIKPSNTAATSSYLLDANGINASTYWSGGSLTLATNAVGQATNNWAVHNAGGDGARIYLQGTTISTPTGAFDMFGIAGCTNYFTNLTWTLTKTNLAAVNIPFAGFANTTSQVAKFQASWSSRVNTNNLFVLPAPPTNN